MNKKFLLSDSDLNKASGGINGDLLAHGIFPVKDKNGEPKFVTVAKKTDGSGFATKEIDKDTVFNIMGSDAFMRKEYDSTGNKPSFNYLRSKWNNWSQ